MSGATQVEPFDRDASGVGAALAHACPDCGSRLVRGPLAMECPACGRRWPIVDGIPCYDEAKYFGEIERDRMIELVARAEEEGWRAAARRAFGDDEEGRAYYAYAADPNRASWIALLPAHAGGAALDVGAGLGAISDALSRTYRSVVAVEPVRERLQFLATRFAQDGRKNVELVQTTVQRLPFSPGTFDVIVLNGILEWIGEWRADVGVRRAQIESLAAIRKLLKPDGTLVVGIENRLAWDSFLGALDHSGLAFTNLMPRWLASLYLRARAPGFYRTDLAVQRGYRTYTYSRRGYAKLLGEAGFRRCEFWWPTDGYNTPHVMWPLARPGDLTSALRKEFDYSQRIHGHSTARVLKQWLLVRSGLIRSLLPAFVIVATPGDDSADHSSFVVRAAAKGLAAENDRGPVDAASLEIAGLQCQSFRDKQVVHVARRGGAPQAIAKVATAGEDDGGRVVAGMKNLEVAAAILARAGGWFAESVPRPIGIIEESGHRIALESAASGEPLDGLSLVARYFEDRTRVERHLDLVVQWIAEFRLAAVAFGDVPGLARIPEAWRESDVRGEGWIQHGDLFPPNVFLDEKAGRLCVVDWDDLAAGYPPLFDFFCLATSLYFVPDDAKRTPGETVHRLSFRHTYFERNWFSALVSNAAYGLADRLGVDRALVGEYFRQYLSVRAHQFAREPDHPYKASLVRLYQEHRDRAVREASRSVFSES